MKLVSERDDKQIAAEDAAQRLRQSMRELAANVLRVLAGAGSAHELVQQMLNVIECYHELSSFSGSAAYPYAPTVPIDQAAEAVPWEDRLRAHPHITPEDIARWRRDGTKDEEDAIDDIVQAALRIRAARLLGQRTQESNAEHKLHQAIRELDEVRKRRAR